MDIFCPFLHINILSKILIFYSLQGNNSCAQDHIDKLFKTLKTFYHPSNTGRWNVSPLNFCLSTWTNSIFFFSVCISILNIPSPTKKWLVCFALHLHFLS